MFRHLKLTAVLFSLGLAPVWALAQEPATPPPPPPPNQDRQPDAEDQDQDRDVEQQQRDQDRQQRDLHRQLRRNLFRPPELPPDSAWLGVQLSPVPAALAYHLRSEDKGLMVANLFEGSPAEKAGLDRYDVITAVDGKPVAGGPDAVRKFSENIRDKRPGQPAELTVISHGQEKTIRAELGKAPADWGRLQPKYTEDPDVAVQRDFGLRGRIMRPGPRGGWVIEDLDEFPFFRDRLERDLRGRREGPRNEPPPPDEALPQKHVAEAVRIDKDGSTLRAQRDENGHITVRRYKTGEDPDKGRTSYDNMDQLRDADREAYDLLQSAIPQEPPMPPRPGQPPLPPPPPNAPEFAPMPPGPGAPGPLPRPGDKALRDEWERRFFRGPLKELKEPKAAAPRTSFDVAADGKITVHFRQGDSEMTRTYSNADELRDKAPSLFRQYEKLESDMKGE